MTRCCTCLQQDITRGRQMVDSLYQGAQGMGGTHNAILSSQDYLSQAARSLNNIEDGFYISPAFLDKLSIHVAKNFLDLPKIKVPLILGALPPEAAVSIVLCNDRLMNPQGNSLLFLAACRAPCFTAAPACLSIQVQFLIAKLSTCRYLGWQGPG